MRIVTGQRVILIAPTQSYRTYAYLDAARQLGIQLIIASEGEYSLVPELAQGIHIRLDDPEAAFQKILSVATTAPVAAVLATDDAVVPLAARIAQTLHLVHNDPQATQIARRKDLARACLQSAGIQVPHFQVLCLAQVAAIDLIDLIELKDWQFPAVVKPLAMSGSRGVIRVDDRSALLNACQRITRILENANPTDPFELEHVLLEEFIPGDEYAIEGLLQQGRLSILTIFAKPDPLNGPFFEETYYVAPATLSDEIQQEIYTTVVHMCQAYGLREGPIHAEVRINAGGVWPLELAARTIGGQCAQLIELLVGEPLESLVLKNALGLPLSPAAFKNQAVGVLMIPIPTKTPGLLRRVEGGLEAEKVEFIERFEISIREAYEVVPLPEGNSYLGFIFARAPSAPQVEKALRQAHACLKIVVAPIIPTN